MKWFLLDFRAIYMSIFLTFVMPNSVYAEALTCRSIFVNAVSVHELSESAQYQLISKIQKSKDEIRNPYSLGSDLMKHYRSENDLLSDIDQLTKGIQVNIENGKGIDQTLNNWVRTDEHAVYLYDLMSSIGLTSFRKELNFLKNNNVHLIESQSSGDSLITYSYEKEGTSLDISLLYRPPEISEKVWLDYSAQTRMRLLKNVKVPHKKFVESAVIAPTGLKPSELGGYSKEVDFFDLKGYGWEIAHKKYEINRQRLMRQIRNLSALFKDTHSFHVHIVFELPLQYQKYPEFIHWYKHLNDYLYLKGLEEGLHGNRLTGVANFQGDLSVRERLVNWFRKFYSSSKTIEEDQQKLDKRNSKFFSAGLRGRLYGAASSPENMKLGLELRDSTRKLELLDQYTKNISLSLESKVWERSEAGLVRTQGLRLHSDAIKARAMMAEIVSPRFAKLFASLEPTAYIGLLKFEESLYFDYQLGSWREPSPAEIIRIREARATYEYDLRALEKELMRYERNGEKTEPELIQAALRMSLSTWAKVAKPADFFSAY